MTFQDIFKSSFLESFSSFSLTDTLLSLAAAFLIGLFIYFVYRKTYSGVLYSRSFNVSLIAILLVTCLVIQGVTSNVVLSLGMVGALSIVRFRTAVKDPMDLVFFSGQLAKVSSAALLCCLWQFWDALSSVFSCWYSQTVSRQTALTCSSSAWTAWKGKRQ